MPTRVLHHGAEGAVGARIRQGRGQAGVAPGFKRSTAFLPAHPALQRHRRPLPSIAIEVPLHLLRGEL